MSECRSNTICVVVERPDHHCGDGLGDSVINIFRTGFPQSRTTAASASFIASFKLPVADKQGDQLRLNDVLSEILTAIN